MTCKHRFHDELLPEMIGAEYLFIGTFNPEWDNLNGNNATYFYGRETNLFWCICPHAFNQPCLIDKGQTEWRTFCKKNKIVLTDLVSEILNVDINNSDDFNAITTFRDATLDNLEFTANTPNILDYIESGQHNLKGVFLTRKSKSGIPNLWKEWQSIVSLCTQKDIHCAALSTPSLYLTSIPKTIKEWNSEIAIGNMN